MSKVILKKSGELANHREELMTDALAVLASRLSLEDGFTLRGLVRLLNRYPDLQRLSSFAPNLAALPHTEPEDG